MTHRSHMASAMVCATTLPLLLLVVLATACSGWESDEVELGERRPGASGESAGEGVALGGWDADNDGILDAEEFASGLADSGSFARWDTDRSGALDPSELAGGGFEAWDTSDDGIVDGEEFAAASVLWLGDGGAAGDFGGWDVDGNDRLDREEFREGAQQRRLFERWDANHSAQVEEEEFGGGVFDLWDANDDRAVVGDEFDRDWS